MIGTLINSWPFNRKHDEVARLQGEVKKLKNHLQYVDEERVALKLIIEKDGEELELLRKEWAKEKSNLLNEIERMSSQLHEERAIAHYNQIKLEETIKELS